MALAFVRGGGRLDVDSKRRFCEFDELQVGRKWATPPQRRFFCSYAPFNEAMKYASIAPPFAAFPLPTPPLPASATRSGGYLEAAGAYFSPSSSASSSVTSGEAPSGTTRLNTDDPMHTTAAGEPTTIVAQPPPPLPPSTAAYYANFGLYATPPLQQLSQPPAGGARVAAAVAASAASSTFYAPADLLFGGGGGGVDEMGAGAITQQRYASIESVESTRSDQCSY